MTVGLGSGSTSALFIEELGKALAEAKVRDIVGIPTSEASHAQARRLNIPVVGFDTHPLCDVTIDGADEVNPSLQLIKGLGGAMLREKLVAQNSRQLIIIVDASKRVDRLGTRSPLPVEVTKFGLDAHTRFLQSLGSRPVLRPQSAGSSEPYVTDNGNLILDCHFPDGIDNADALNASLGERSGIVEHGLFLRLATLAIVAEGDGISTLGSTTASRGG